MKRLGKIAVCLAGGLLLNAGLRAANRVTAPAPAPASNPSQDNPYAAIAVRNIFGLNPLVAAVDSNALLEASLPKITPTGIMTVFGQSQVLFKVAPAKPGPGAKEDYYTLSEGQRQDDIEVIKIDDKKSLVTFDNHGTTQELPLAEASATGGGGSGGGGMSGGGGGGAGNAGPGGFTRFGAGPGGPNGGMANGNPGFNSGGPTGANAGMSFGENTQGRIYQPEASNLTPEQSQAILLVNKFKAFTDHDPTAPLFPPSAGDKEAGIPSNTEENNGPPAP